MFKENFILSFSDDDDIHCDLKTLYEYGKNVINSEYIIPVRSMFKGEIITNILSHPAFWRFLFPWRVFYNYPMTLDILPVRMEDQRFVARMVRMNAFRNLNASLETPIKYFYNEEAGRYNSYLHQESIAPYMSVFDYRIYKTQEWMLRIDRKIKSYGTYSTNRRYNTIYTDKENLYAYSSRLTIPLHDRAVKIDSWDIKDNKIMPVFEEISSSEITAEEMSEQLPHEVIFHPDEIIVCNVLYDNEMYKYASFPMNIIRRSKLSHTFGQVELIEPYKSWSINLHEYEKMNIIHGGKLMNYTLGFGCVALLVLLLIKMKNKRYQHK